MIETGFILGAGLATRMRPLADHIPKPLISVMKRPLITFQFDHLIASAGVKKFIVNTHHCAHVYEEVFPDANYRTRPIHFSYEPVLLETGGGMKNVAERLQPAGADDTPFIAYNGDILTDLPLQPAIEHHKKSKNLVTWILRSCDGNRQVAWDAQSGQILDIGNRLKTDLPKTYSFAGIYLVSPQFLNKIPSQTKISVLPILLEMISNEGGFGGVVINEGAWFELGTQEMFSEAVAKLQLENPPVFPRYH